MKVYVGWDERYPVGSMYEGKRSWSRDTEVELTEAEWADYQRVEAEYDAWQERMHQLEAAKLPLTRVPDPETLHQQRINAAKRISQGFK